MIKIISIKTLFFLLITVFPNQIFGQNIYEGKYCVDYKIKDISKCIFFKKDNTFEVVDSKHLGKNDIIIGKWFLKNKKIILKYNNPKLSKSFNIETYSSSTLNDSIKITFKVKDFNFGPTLGLHIKIPSKKILLEANNEGIAELKMKKSPLILSGYTEYIGYENCYFSFDLRKNHQINLFVSETHNQILIKENDTLSISKNQKYLINVKSGINEKWIQQ